MSLYFSSLSYTPARDVGPSGKPILAEITLLLANATGSRVLNARTDKSIRIWRASSLGLLQPITIEHAHPREVSGVLWNTNTDYSFASVGKDAWVKLWTGTGQLEREIKVEMAGKPAHLVVIEYLPDGNYLAVADEDGTVILLDVHDHYLKIAEYGPKSRVSALKWPNKGHEYVLVALENGLVEILAVNAETRLLYLAHTLKGHKSPVTCISVDPRGRFLALGTAEGTVSIWNLSNLLNSHALAKVDQAISSVEISRDGSYIAVAYEQETSVKVYDSFSLAEVYEVPASSSGKTGVSALKWLSSRGNFVYVGHQGKVVHFARRTDERR